MIAWLLLDVAMSDEAMTEQRRRSERIIAVTVLAVVTVLFLCSRSVSDPDYRMSRPTVEPWMLEALPGIGPKKRDPAHAALSVHEDQKLPRSAQELLPVVFKD